MPLKNVIKMTIRNVMKCKIKRSIVTQMLKKTNNYSWNDAHLCYEVPSMKSFIIFLKKISSTLLVSSPLP